MTDTGVERMPKAETDPEKNLHDTIVHVLLLVKEMDALSISKACQYGEKKVDDVINHELWPDRMTLELERKNAY